MTDAIILQCAKSYLEDLETGLEDGTYEEGASLAIKLSEAIKQAENPDRVIPVQVCKYCGSDEVYKDAYAAQDPDTGEWYADNVFDKGSYCEKCEGETTLIDKKD